MIGERLEQPLHGHVPAPFRLDRDDLGPVSARHLPQPPAEEARDAHDHLVTRLYEVSHARLHPGVARPGEREDEGALGAPNPPEKLDDLVHHDAEVGVEMAEDRLLHRGEHAGRDVRRARPAKKAVGRAKLLGQRRASFSRRCAGTPLSEASMSSTGWSEGSGRPARRRADETWTRQPGFALA